MWRSRGVTRIELSLTVIGQLPWGVQFVSLIYTKAPAWRWNILNNISYKDVIYLYYCCYFFNLRENEGYSKYLSGEHFLCRSKSESESRNLVMQWSKSKAWSRLILIAKSFCSYWTSVGAKTAQHPVHCTHKDLFPAKPCLTLRTRSQMISSAMNLDNT